MKTIRKCLFIVLTLTLLVIPMPNVSAAFQQVDMFKNSSAVKGIQGVPNAPNLYDTHHRLINMNILDCYYTMEDDIFAKGYILPYTYKGKEYCFAIPGHIYNRVGIANQKNESISIVFLMKWNERASWLIDDAARDNGGHLYYAPETEGAAGEWLEAFFSFFCKEMGTQNLHVDNFILGNEVNMPNHWHYTGSTNPDTCATKYADAFRIMYNVVRSYSSLSRCSISLDHSWNHNDEGRGIAARDFLTRFASRLDSVQPGIDWCVSAHLYPSILYETDFWNSNLNPLSYDAYFVDGKNLYYMTNYIKENFGEQHRVMLTEQGFCDDKGAAVQAASLAYSYYAAMYDPMVDSFIINTENAGYAGGHSLNFDITGTLAGDVYEKIGNGNSADQDWIASICLPVIGVDSWSQIIPYYGEVPEINEPYCGNINSELICLDLKHNENGSSYLTGQIVVVEWVDGQSTVPKVTPNMTFKSTDGTENIEVFVTPTGTNKYYFDRFIEGLSSGKEYVFEISSGNELNYSPNRSMNVSLATSPQMISIKNLGKVGSQKISYYQADNGELRLYRRHEEYIGNINSELKKTELVTGPNGNYVSGEIVVVEWEDDISTVPTETPIMYFRSTDGLEELPVWVTPTGTNTYYFDRSLGDLDISKEYVFTIESGDSLNISPYRSMIVTTAAMEQKEGILWESSTQYVCYRTDSNTAELRIYGVNK